MTDAHHPPRWRIALVREGGAPGFPATTVRSSEDVARAFQLLRDRDREEFWVAALDGKNRLIGTHCASIGTLTASLVHPREVVKILVLSSAAACILVHVHTRGDPTPSAEDHAITERLVQVCALLGIAILDHVIVGVDRHFSFADAGQLTGSPGRHRLD